MARPDLRGALDLFCGPRPHDGVWEVGVYDHTRRDAELVVQLHQGLPQHHSHTGTMGECIALLRTALDLMEAGTAHSLSEAFRVAQQQHIQAQIAAWAVRLTMP